MPPPQPPVVSGDRHLLPTTGRWLHAAPDNHSWLHAEARAHGCQASFQKSALRRRVQGPPHPLHSPQGVSAFPQGTFAPIMSKLASYFAQALRSTHLHWTDVSNSCEGLMSGVTSQHRGNLIF